MTQENELTALHMMNNINQSLHVIAKFWPKSQILDGVQFNVEVKETKMTENNIGKQSKLCSRP